MSNFLILRFYTAFHICIYILDILNEGIQCFLFFDRDGEEVELFSVFIEIVEALF